MIKLPKEEIHYEKLGKKVCQQYALKEFVENVIFLDTGDASCSKLREFKFIY